MNNPVVPDMSHFMASCMQDDHGEWICWLSSWAERDFYDIKVGDTVIVSTNTFASVLRIGVEPNNDNPYAFVETLVCPRQVVEDGDMDMWFEVTRRILERARK